MRLLIVIIVLVALEGTARGQVLQLDAEELAETLTNGDIVSSWGPATGQGTPTFLTGQTPNGGPAVSFDVGDHFGQLAPSFFPPAGTGDWIVAVVIRPDSINAYHNIIDDDAQNRPMLWIDPDNRYELNFHWGHSPTIGAGPGGWDIVIADSQNNLLYVNSPCSNGTGGAPITYSVAEAFDLFNRDGGQTYSGLVAELRVYTNPADFGDDYLALYVELVSKWIHSGIDGDSDGLEDDDEISIYGTDPDLADTDGDGLADGCEVGIRSDPNVTDTDSDGLEDGEEVAVHGTNPNTSDSDGDGLSDSLEVANGSNPLTTEPGLVLKLDANDLGAILADGDVVTFWSSATSHGTPIFQTGQTPNGSPAVLFDGGDHFGQRPPSQFPPSGTGDWIVATVLRPDSIDAYHNIIDDDAQNRPMLWIDPNNRYELNFSGGSSPTIGEGPAGWDIVIADSRNNSLYVNSSIPNGSGREPITYTAAENFELFNRNGGQMYHGLVAELRVYTDPEAFGSDFEALHEELFNKWFAPLDTDGDGLTDDDEDVYGTDPTVADTDGDGLYDGTEVDVAAGTGCPNPLEVDSDGDTLTDGAEADLGTDPCNTDTDGDLVPDNIDDLPTWPGVTSGFIETELRDLCVYTIGLELTLFDAPNNNARKGRRNAMCNKLNAAANAVASGDFQEAHDQTESVLQKLDGDPNPKDWMVEGTAEKEIVRDEVALLASLISEEL